VAAEVWGTGLCQGLVAEDSWGDAVSISPTGSTLWPTLACPEALEDLQALKASCGRRCCCCLKLLQVAAAALWQW
jgi:hypothetical protein